MIINTIRSRLESHSGANKLNSLKDSLAKTKYNLAGKTESEEEAIKVNIHYGTKDESKEFKTNCNHCLSWLLALTITFLVLWVFWTITIRKYYSSLATSYFPGKAGSRIVMYTVVFYILIGFIALLSMNHGVNLPSPSLKLMKYIRVPFTMEYFSILELIFIIIYAIFLINVFFVTKRNKIKEDSDPFQKWYALCKILGMVTTYNFLLLFIPISKRSFWLELLNFQFERAVKIHKVLSFFFLISAAFHIGAGLYALYINGSLKECLIPTGHCLNSNNKARTISYGWMGVLIALPMVITSIFPWFRRQKFEWFYYTHFLFIPFLILIQLHYDHFMYYLAPGLSAYILDRVLRWCSTRNAVTILNLYSPIPGIVRIVLAVEPNFTCEPGQWVTLNIPYASYFQYHPFSISSAPPTPENPVITIDMKVVGDWTKRVQELANCFDPSSSADASAYIDGFYGCSHSRTHGYLTHPVILMVAGGIGVTPLMSSLRTILAQNETTEKIVAHVKRIVFVWVVSNERMLDLYRDDLSALQNELTEVPGCQIEIQLYVTLSNSDDLSSDLEVDKLSSNNTLLYTNEESHMLTTTRKVQPYIRQVMGHGHNMVLTTTAGTGIILAIFLSNVIETKNEEWAFEVPLLILLVLAVLCPSISLVWVMSSSIFRSNLVQAIKTSSFADIYNINPDKTKRKETNNSNLEFTSGYRPNFEVIFNDLKEKCVRDGLGPSVGVGVCGPLGLLHDVTKNCTNHTSSNLRFVLDSESFNW